MGASLIERFHLALYSSSKGYDGLCTTMMFRGVTILTLSLHQTRFHATAFVDF
jgi:hypothetical protein